MIHKVPTMLVPDLWPAIEPHAEAAMEHHPFMDAHDLMRLIMRGHAQLFVVAQDGKVQGFAAMEVVEYPSRKVANILACGGEDGFLSVAVHELLPVLKQWGREQGADICAILGARPGWKRALRDEGGEAASFVTWWARLGHVEGRRLKQADADSHQSTVGPGSALSH